MATKVCDSYSGTPFSCCFALHLRVRIIGLNVGLNTSITLLIRSFTHSNFGDIYTHSVFYHFSLLVWVSRHNYYSIVLRLIILLILRHQLNPKRVDHEEGALFNDSQILFVLVERCIGGVNSRNLTNLHKLQQKKQQQQQETTKQTSEHEKYVSVQYICRFKYGFGSVQLHTAHVWVYTRAIACALWTWLPQHTKKQRKAKWVCSMQHKAKKE